MFAYFDLVNKIKEIDIDEVEKECIKLNYRKATIVFDKEFPDGLEEYAKSKEILCVKKSVLERLELDLEDKSKDRKPIIIKINSYGKNCEKRIIPEEININGKNEPKEIIYKKANNIYNKIEEQKPVEKVEEVRKDNSPIQNSKQSFLEKLFKKPDRL